MSLWIPRSNPQSALESLLNVSRHEATYLVTLDARKMLIETLKAEQGKLWQIISLIRKKSMTLSPVLSAQELRKTWDFESTGLQLSAMVRIRRTPTLDASSRM